MIVTVPHYGNTFIGLKVLFDGLDIKYIIPPPTNKKTLELGVMHSPEDICQPFKLMLGNYIQSLDQGADTIILIATNGPCKFGEYAALQERLLKKAGYCADFIVFNSQNSKKALLEGLKKIGSQVPYNRFKKIIAVLRGIKALMLIDNIESKLRYLSGYENSKGTCKQMLHQCYKEVINCNCPMTTLSVLKKYKKEIKKISINTNKTPVKIAIIGEIYTISEPYSSKFVEDQLMEYGISVSRSLRPSWWLKDTILKPLKLNSLGLRIAAKKYIYHCAGGYTKETVGKAILASNHGFDGAIQIFPVGCTPEIIAKPILEKISQDKEFPIMTLVVDEMTGEEGYLTRVEAFTDMLERRRKQCII